VREWWLSSNRMTFFVAVDDRQVIVEAAPIARKFVGQPLEHLERWMARQGGFRKERIEHVR